MTVSTAQYVDLLVKKIEGVAKTDTAANKSPSNESIASPLLNRGDTCWTQSNLIPPTAAATANLIQAYTGTSAIQCAADNTTVPVGGVYPTWLTNLTDWIPQEFGSTYFIKAYVDSPGVANPQTTGTQIFDSGSGGTGEWFFDYQAGLLNFIGGTIPAVLTSSKVIYIVGYRYIGLKGVQNLGNVTVGNIFTDGYYYANGQPFSGGGGSSYGNAQVAAYLPTYTGNLVSLTGDVITTTNVSANGNVSANNFSSNTANIVTLVTDSITANSVTTAYNLVSAQSTANSIVLGNANIAVNQTSWLSTSTNTISTTTLFSVPANSISSVDFGITATSGNNRQVSKILTITVNNLYNYTEYGSLNIGSMLGNFFVDVVLGNLLLQVTPYTSNNIHYTVVYSYDNELNLGI